MFVVLCVRDASLRLRKGSCHEKTEQNAHHIYTNNSTNINVLPASNKAPVGYIFCSRAKTLLLEEIMFYSNLSTRIQNFNLCKWVRLFVRGVIRGNTRYTQNEKVLKTKTTTNGPIRNGTEEANKCECPNTHSSQQPNVTDHKHTLA